MSQKNKYGIFRYLTYWLYVFLALGVPVILIAEKYEIFRRVGAAKLTVWGILILLIALFFLRGQIKRVITGMDDGLVKGIILGIWGLIPMAVLYLALVICRKQIDSFLFIALWSLISNAAGAVCQAAHLHFKARQAAAEERKEGDREE